MLKPWQVLVIVLGMLLASQGYAGDAPEVLMFREALRDPEMQSLARGSFSDERLAVICAVLSLQWRSGRIAGSSPSNPGDSGIALVMHGMAETTMFVLDYFAQEKVDVLTQRVLRRFEESHEFREATMRLCTDAMIDPLGFVIDRNNLSQY